MTIPCSRTTAALETFNRFETFHGYDDGTIWTASRCLRMLRPLQTALQKLEKDVFFGNRIGPLLEERSRKRRRLSTKSTDREDTASEALAKFKSQLNVHKDDPDFQPPEPTARFRKTYSTRRQKFRLQERSETKVHLAQPLDGATFIPFSLDFDDQDDSKTAEITVGLYKTMEKSIADNRTGASLGGYRAIYVALDHILQASDIRGPDIHDVESLVSQSDSKTSTSNAKLELERWYTKRDNNAARSMFKMCLNQLPNLVALEQESDNCEPENDRNDATQSLYRHLEDFSTNRDNGWRPLRDLLRAQSLIMLCDKVRTGLLAQRTVLWAFVELCRVRHYSHGGQLLLEAWSDAIAAAKLRDDGWHQGARQAGFHLIEIHRLSQDLGCQHLYWTWFATAAENGSIDFADSRFHAHTWARALNQLFIGSELEGESVISMLERLTTCAVTKLVADLSEFAMLKHHEGRHLPRIKTVERLANEMNSNEKLTSTFPTAFSSILACLFRVIESGQSGESIAVHVVRRLLLHTERIIFINLQPDMDYMQAYSALLPWWTALLADAVCTTSELADAIDMKIFWRIAETRENEDLVALLGKHTNMIALNCSRRETCKGLQATSKDYLQRMITHLLDLTKSRGLKVFAQAACAAAFEFNELYPSKGNADFAVQVELETESLEQAIDSVHTHSQKSSATDDGAINPDAAQFHWDDSVSEFVKAPVSTQPLVISVVVPTLSQVQRHTRDSTEHHATPLKERATFQSPMVLVPLHPSGTATEQDWAWDGTSKSKGQEDDENRDSRLLIHHGSVRLSRKRKRSSRGSGFGRSTAQESEDHEDSEDELAM